MLLGLGIVTYIVGQGLRYCGVPHNSWVTSISSLAVFALALYVTNPGDVNTKVDSSAEE